MKKQSVQNEKVRVMCDKVLNGTQMSEAEIDCIVGSSQLFTNIRSAVSRELISPDILEPLGPRTGSFHFRWKTAIASSVVLLIFTAVAFLLLDPGPVGNSLDVAVIDEKRLDQPINANNYSKPVDTSYPSEYRARPVKNNRYHRPARLAALSSPAAKVRSGKTDIADEMGEFQSVVFDGDTTIGEGRIVRVELPRSSLYAMGVGIPVENGKPFVKTDLYIGSDGTMRAVRVSRIN